MKNLQKHMLKITNNSPKDREVLHLINYDSKTDTINATDSFRVISMKSNTPIENTININMKTMMVSSLNYPDISRVIPDKYFDSIDITLLENIKDANSLAKKNKKSMSKLIIKNNVLTIEFNTGDAIIEVELAKTKNSDRVIGYFNNKYLSDLLDFIHDISNTYSSITIKHKSDTRPISFVFDNRYTYVLTPIRVQ